MEYDYIGWVPCVSGRLFFDFTYPGLGQPQCHINHIESYNGDILYHRYITLASIVDWKDSKDKNLYGEYKVILTGHKTSDDINLQGSIYIFPEYLENNKIEEIGGLIRDMRSNAESSSDIKSDYNNLISKLNKIEDNSFYRVDYIVESPGFTKLKYCSNNKKFSDEHQYTIARQAYYFIKYALHRHRHHHDKAESLTTIHPIHKDKNKIGIELLNDLRKSLVQLKRDFKPYSCQNIYQTSGIASYAISLAESCYKEEYLDKKEYKSEKSYFNNVKASLEVLSSAVEKDIAKRTMISGNARSIILFMLSIIMPLILIYSDVIKAKVDEDSLIAKVLAEILTSGTNITVVLSSILLLYWIYHTLKLNYGSFIFSFKHFRDILDKIFQGKDKATYWLVAFIIIFLSVIIFSLYDFIMK